MAITKLQSESLNLADDYTFTGTVSGAGGITMADQWRLTVSITSDVQPIASNLERCDESSYGNIGTGMTESSGVFTFPETGIYLVLVQAGITFTNTADNQVNLYTQVTTDNSTYNDIGRAYAGSNSSSGNSIFTVYSQTYVDVTDTSQVKVRFRVASLGSTASAIDGDTNRNSTSFNFIRLGDT